MLSAAEKKGLVVEREWECSFEGGLLVMLLFNVQHQYYLVLYGNCNRISRFWSRFSLVVWRGDTVDIGLRDIPSHTPTPGDKR